MSPEFKSKLKKAVKIVLQEMRDGCVSCLEHKGYCFKHYKEAQSIILHPRNSEKVRELLK